MTTLRKTAERLLAESRQRVPATVPDKVCPWCGRPGLTEPSNEQWATLLDWPADRLFEAASHLSRGHFGNCTFARLDWCATCGRIVPAGRFPREWFDIIRRVWLGETILRRDSPPGLVRNFRDLRLLGFLTAYRNAPPESWLRVNGYKNWLDYHSRTGTPEQREAIREWTVIIDEVARNLDCLGLLAEDQPSPAAPDEASREAAEDFYDEVAPLSFG